MVARRIEGPISRVDRDQAMVGPIKAKQHRGNVLEDAAHIAGRTHRFVPVLFGDHMAVLLHGPSQKTTHIWVAQVIRLSMGARG